MKSQLRVKTPHYTFDLFVKNISTKELHQYYFLVGDKADPCLEGTINLETSDNNNRYKIYENTAKLIKINALESCALGELTQDTFENYSFGTELLDAIVFFINSQFPQITHVKLKDSSYIPCNRLTNDNLDLLIYSIALYKKTWYEKKLNAFLLPPERHTNYRNQVEIYASPQTKNELSFNIIAGLARGGGNELTINKFRENYDSYKLLYESSETLPEFFQKLNKTIKREERCKFFKDWLEGIIEKYVNIYREWTFELFPKIEVISTGGSRKRTRKNMNSK